MIAELDVMEYRVVVIVDRSNTVLVRETPSCYRLPRVKVSARTRLARQLCLAMRSEWGLDIFMLDFIESRTNDFSCVVAELRSSEWPSDFVAVSLTEVSSAEFSELERTKMQWLLSDTTERPFSRIGWIDDASRWVETVTQRSVGWKGRIEQYNAGGPFTLVRFLTDGADFWLKGTGDRNAHECSITRLLSELGGPYLPEFIASKDEWNAWLMYGGATSATELPQSSVADVLNNAVASMAALQMETMGAKKNLLAAGAFDHGIDIFESHARETFDYFEEMMSFQTSTKVPRLEKKRLDELCEIFYKVCNRVRKLAIPDTILHGDMNLGNLLVGAEHCQFIDWCEAYIGNPLITFQHLLLLNGAETVRSRKDRLLQETYRTKLLELCDASAIDEGFVYMPMLAAFSAIYGRGDCLDPSVCADPRRQARARTIARYLDRAASEPALLAALRI